MEDMLFKNFREQREHRYWAVIIPVISATLPLVDRSNFSRFNQFKNLNSYFKIAEFFGLGWKALNTLKAKSHGKY